MLYGYIPLTWQFFRFNGKKELEWQVFLGSIGTKNVFLLFYWEFGSSNSIVFRILSLRVPSKWTSNVVGTRTAYRIFFLYLHKFNCFIVTSMKTKIGSLSQNYIWTLKWTQFRLWLKFSEPPTVKGLYIIQNVLIYHCVLTRIILVYIENDIAFPSTIFILQTKQKNDNTNYSLWL